MYGASLKSHATCCLIMELAAGGNLHQRIYDTSRPRMTLIEALQVIAHHSQNPVQQPI